MLYLKSYCSRTRLQHEEVRRIIIDGERYYTAEEIGAFLGISTEEVDKIAKANGLQPPVGESNEY